ncbi:MAG TPA: hypothetical protein VEC76_12110 [Streptosporangiaceae bacterium]|nr:hypothetical protein [Streptosporangiaceae bacterium]
MTETPNADRVWSLVAIDQQRITALDTVTVAIKGWVIALDSALTGIAFSSGHRSLVLVAIVATLFLAVLDFRYRTVQLGHAARSSVLEERFVCGYEFSHYQDRASSSVVWRFIQSRYLTTSAFYAALLLMLALVFAVIS